MKQLGNPKVGRSGKKMMMHGYCQGKARKERRGTTTKVMTGCNGATLGRVTQIVHHILARKNAQSSTTFANESAPILPFF